MEQRCKIYERAFKEKEVELSLQRTNISELAWELGISAPQLYNWKKEHLEFGPSSFPGNGNVKQAPEQEQITFLEKKLKDAEMERDILKKAIGIFSKNGQ